MQRKPTELCLYCGCIATTKDHLTPKSWGHFSEKTVPACWDCNSKILKNNVGAGSTIESRTAYVYKKLLAKYGAEHDRTNWCKMRLSILGLMDEDNIVINTTPILKKEITEEIKNEDQLEEMGEPIPEINEELFEFLLELFDGLDNSPAHRLIAIQTFILNSLSYLNNSQIREIKEKIIAPLEAEAKEHSERGKKFGTKKAKVRAAKTYDYPGYCEELLPCQCATCKGNLEGRGFRYHAKDGRWYYYHPELKCFPKEHEATMKNNPKWLRSLTTEIN